MARNRQQSNNGWSLLCGFSALMFVLVVLQLDVTRILRTISLCLLALGSFTLFLYLFGNKLEVAWKQIFHRQRHERQGSELTAEDLANQQKAVRERIQNEYKEKAAKYEEEVLRPRQEAKKALLEEEFYKFAGPAWKGTSQRLGDGRQPNDDDKSTTDSEKQLPRKRVQGTSKDASAVRKLTESATRPPPVIPDQPNPERKVIMLPDEPDANEKECITIAMRGLQSTVRKRRFLYTDRVQVLLDWMTKQGYHPKLYTVCTTFPRRDLSQYAENTLQEVQLIKDVMLVIEEKE